MKFKPSPKEIVEEFRQVVGLAGVMIGVSEIETQILQARHHPPSHLPKGKMAVYVFNYGTTTLKVGKAGSKSNARYTSQHYNAGSAPSTLAATLLKSGADIGIDTLTTETVGPWIKKHTTRLNFLLNADYGSAVLTLFEAYVQCRLKPKFEGFASQQ